MHLTLIFLIKNIILIYCLKFVPCVHAIFFRHWLVNKKDGKYDLIPSGILHLKDKQYHYMYHVIQVYSKHKQGGHYIKVITIQHISMILSYFFVIEIKLLYCEKFTVCSCLCTTILFSKPFLTGRINKNKLINTRSVIYSIDNLT